MSSTIDLCLCKCRLLEKGADAGLGNAQGTTPLMKAAANAQVATVKMLVK
jgi:ankyrin repeat protein